MGLEVKVEGLTPVNEVVNSFWLNPKGTLVRICSDTIVIIDELCPGGELFIGTVLFSESKHMKKGNRGVLKTTDAIYLDGQWDAFYKIIRGEEEKVSNEIDWTVREQLLICEASGTIVSYERSVNGDHFRGSIIYKGSASGYNVGYTSDQFEKSFFKPFKGTVILTQK